MTISILHPFTPQAAGVVEESVATYHSQPHLKAMQNLTKDNNYTGSIEYLTPRLFKYSFDFDGITYRFFPVDFTLNGDHKKWKKQVSSSCYRYYKKNLPEVTIINMSGHSSPFSHRLGKLILSNQKKYIAMLGGQHYTDNADQREFYTNAAHILVHTYLQKADMEKLDMFKGLDIRVFPLGVDTNVFSPLKNENEHPKLLYVGRIVEWKRIHMAIEALKSLVDAGFKDAELNIIGPTSSPEYKNELECLVKENSLENQVHFLGHKEHDELPYYFQEADLFTLPSDKETFGMVMIEAMACGTPVAGINCPGGPADVITDQINGLLSSPEEYSKKIVAYFENNDKQKLISKGALQKARDEYSIAATSKVLRRSVEDALNE
ncbi:hypothetical protein GCM10009117_03740 [Gangjinia marincola]|uniref:Glycosyl transferase family 1 domain-containing protein n=1 Tax=Gangjinia marincola TaxID=578463 RepID=A0ABP3XPI2_9FLAO